MLRAGQPEGQPIVETVEQLAGAAVGFAGAGDGPGAPGGNEHLQTEELAQDEVAAGVFLLRVVLGEMDGAQGRAAWHGVETVGQRGGFGVEIDGLERAVDEGAQAALAQALGRGVDGRDALEVDEVFLVGVVFDDLELGVVDADALAAGLGLAVDDHALAVGEDFLDVPGVEPADRQQGRQGVAVHLLQRDLEHLALAAQARGFRRDDDAANAHGLVVAAGGEVFKMAAVLVTARVVREEIADGVEVEAFEGLDTRGADAGEVGERRGEFHRASVTHAPTKIDAGVLAGGAGRAHAGRRPFLPMKRLLLLVTILALGGCAFMSDEDKDFYGRGWVHPTELDQQYPHHAGTPTGTTAASAPVGGSSADQLPANPDPAHDSAWDVPGVRPQ